MRAGSAPREARKRGDSGSITNKNGLSAKGRTPPSTKSPRQPKLDTIDEAASPAEADPMVKPQNISVTSEARRYSGQTSAVSVMDAGIAPPRPSPVMKRSAVSV